MSATTRAAPLFRRAATRRTFSAAAEPTKGPRLPEGNDPSAYHGPEHAAKDTRRWLMVSAIFALPVTGFGVLQSMKPHEHPPAPVQYDYMRRANRVPRFPWGVRYATLRLSFCVLRCDSAIRFCRGA